jgi:hypothetical protein
MTTDCAAGHCRAISANLRHTSHVHVGKALSHDSIPL